MACGSERRRLLRRLGPYEIMQCPRCLLAWTANTSLEPTVFYDQSYFVGGDTTKGYADYLALSEAMDRTNRARLRRLRRFCPHATTLLDAGCGPGFFVRAASRDGLNAYGLEVSAFAAHYGREELGQYIVSGTIGEEGLAQLPPRFDVITLWDVIEHLDAPDAALSLLASRLSPGGVLAVSTGDIASLAARMTGRYWHLYNLPEHLWFFSARSLARLLRRAGLTVIDVRREVCWYTIQYVVDRLLASVGRRDVRWPGREMLHRISLPLTLLDILTIHARRP